MEFLTRSASVRDRIRAWRGAGSRVALVPTTGTLHKGHMSLVAQAQERADHVIVSIFADPRDGAAQSVGADRELMQKLGASIVFAPPLQEIYPLGREASVTVQLPNIADIFEGEARPGHFSDSLTVLTKLFNLIKPDLALFGERDYQHLVLVRRLVDDLFMPVDIVGCATWRDSDGLAAATANRHLSADERTLAPRLYAVLSETAARIDAGSRDYADLQRQGLQTLRDGGFTPEYFAIRQATDLKAAAAGARDLVILAAARLNATRLIDNLRVRVIERY